MNKNELKETGAVHKDGKLDMRIWYTSGCPCHWHDEFEFIYVTKGSCRLTVSGNTVIVQKGQAALINSGELHDMLAEYGGSYFAVVVHPHLCGSECTHLFSGAYAFQRLFTSETPAEAKILENLITVQRVYMNRPVGYELRLKSLMTDIFAIIFEHELFADNTISSRTSTQVFEEMVTYIHTHYAEKLTLDLLAEHFNYSKSYIIRLFKQYTGKTPLEYINRYRISLAQLKLVENSKDMLEIASEVGMENPGHFINLFRRYTGHTPGKWRKASAKTE